MANNDLWWGVDSMGRADRPDSDPSNDFFWKTNKHWKDREKPTLYEYVVDVMGGWHPFFWGRYIAGTPNVLTDEEVTYLSKQGCAILPIFDLDQKSVINALSSVGDRHARQAIDAANKLTGFPKNATAWIYADIEATSGIGEWLKGWWKVMLASSCGGIGGLYANTANINRRNFNDPYADALRDFAQDKTDSRILSSWSNLWAMWPHKPQKSDPEQLTLKTPDAPTGRRDDLVLWQYATECFKVGKFWSFDMNVANDRGFNSMWLTS